MLIFLADYFLVHRLDMRSIFQIMLLLVDPVCQILIEQMLSDCDEKKATTILNIININALERRVIHEWYDSHQKLDVTWNGRIKHEEKQMASRDPLLVINYWEKN